ncbi:MAG: hypothetical protein LBI59_09595 [Candidatus Accumulibacter sp.]|jgi:hypothetical protein|nr:hypothetical protein [Accumulibacter sp.]
MLEVPEHRRLRRLIELALSEGWIVCSTNDGGLKLVKRGLPPIFSRATALLHPDGSLDNGGERHA